LAAIKKTKGKVMKQLTKILLLTILITSCNTETHSNKDDLKEQETVMNDTTPKVTGIGGIFFHSKNPQEIREWYGKNLGLAIDDYGSPFEFRNANRPEEVNYLRWSPFEEGTEYFKPSEKEFMINYRVQNIEGLVKNLRENGVTIVDKIEEFEYGKFVHIMDPEGNKIELWEPLDSFLTSMQGKTTK
jgi:predicted enzyme related to lactoylglutathione lyase